MVVEYHSGFKTMGPRTAQLVTELNQRNQSAFTLADVEAITGLRSVSARSLIQKAQKRCLVTRLKPGLFNLVPFELGRATEYVGNPYLIAQKIAAGAEYFISHGSAFELHRMVTQPQLVITASCVRRIRPQTVGGYAYRFFQVPDSAMFGISKYWVTKENCVFVSDPERSIIDGLQKPDLVGGITEVAKALWMAREHMKVDRLVEYALRINIGAVIRRLGYLLEAYGLADDGALDPLRARLTAGYQRLDPLFPAEGHKLARWRLQINIAPEELDAVRHG